MSLAFNLERGITAVRCCAGEKDEELEALRSDLEDVKETFRIQLQALMMRDIEVNGAIPVSRKLDIPA